MSTAAEFFGKISHFHNAYRLAVFLAKQRHGTCFLRFFDCQNFRYDRNVLGNLFIDDLLWEYGCYFIL